MDMFGANAIQTNQVVTWISVSYASKISRHVAIRNIRKISSVLIDIVFLIISRITVYSLLLWEIPWSNDCINVVIDAARSASNIFEM